MMRRLLLFLLLRARGKAIFALRTDDRLLPLLRPLPAKLRDCDGFSMAGGSMARAKALVPASSKFSS